MVTLPVLLRRFLNSGLHVSLRRDWAGVVYDPAAVGRAVHDLEECHAVFALALVDGELGCGHDVRRVEAARLHLARQHRMLGKERRVPVQVVGVITNKGRQISVSWNCGTRGYRTCLAHLNR